MDNSADIVTHQAKVDELPDQTNGVRGYVTDYFAGLQTLLAAVDVGQVEKVVALFVEAFHTGKRVVICGNGGSASTASHLVCDLSKSIFMDIGKQIGRAHV